MAKVANWPRRMVLAHAVTSRTMPWTPPLRETTPTMPPSMSVETTRAA